MEGSKSTDKIKIKGYWRCVKIYEAFTQQYFNRQKHFRDSKRGCLVLGSISPQKSVMKHTKKCDILDLFSFILMLFNIELAANKGSIKDANGCI